MNTDLQYPIGRFQRPEIVTDAMRNEFIAHIADTPGKVIVAVANLSNQQLDTPYRPRGWTLRQVVHHLPDSHINAYVRFKLALTEREPVVKPYNERDWAETREARTAPIEPSLDLLDALHRRWIILLRSLTPEDFARTYRHPESGIASLDTLLATYAWHGLHHVAHITSLRSRQGWL